jgi:GH15 family glucan-1,4-alpha-glucosidase
LQLELAGSIPLGVLGARSYGRTTLAQGQSAFITLSWGGSNVPASQDEAFSALNTTVDFWRNWLSSANIPDHPWKPYLDRSALTLKGLSYAPTGAIMAASTTLTAGNPRRGAQLGLPVHLDQRLGVHAPLAVPAGLRLGGDRVLGVRR